MAKVSAYQAKHFDAVLDWRWPFAALLTEDADSYGSHVFVESTGDLTLSDERVVDGGDVVARIAGGTRGRAYTIRGRLTSAAGQVYVGVLELRIHP